MFATGNVESLLLWFTCYLFNSPGQGFISQFQNQTNGFISNDLRIPIWGYCIHPLLYHCSILQFSTLSNFVGFTQCSQISHVIYHFTDPRKRTSPVRGSSLSFRIKLMASFLITCGSLSGAIASIHCCAIAASSGFRL